MLDEHAPLPQAWSGAGAVLGDIPSQDAANTVANYSQLKKSNRRKRIWGKAMAAGKYLRAAEAIRK